MLQSIRLIKKLLYTLMGMVLFMAPTVYAATVPVTYENYGEAQATMQMNDYQELAHGINKWYHFEMPVSIKNQPTIRMNRDTLYSIAVVNVTKEAVITLPKNGKRYMSLLVYNELGYTNKIYYGKGSYKLTPENVGSDYALLIVRTLVDANNPKDIRAVNALQDKLVIKSNDSKSFTMKDWDMTSYTKMYNSLVKLFALLPDASNMFGKKENVDPTRFLIGTAGGFGGLPDTEAVYLNRVPKLLDKSLTMTLKDVPVDGFWSFTVYNKEGYLFSSKHGLPSLNNLTATPSKDGAYTLYFGNCEKYKENCLAIEDGWNFVVRLYQPREEIISGEWTLPELMPIPKSKQAKQN